MKEPKAAPAYHHGNLRAGLLDAALTILDAEGVDAVTIRAVARAAGVSHAAPANHFADRKALLTALAAGIFAALAGRIARKLAAAPGGRAARLRVFAAGPAEQVAAFFMIVAILTIVLPMTNTVPSVGLALMAAGLIQRDGLFVLVGMGVAAGWALFLGLVVAGVVLGAGWAAGFAGLLPG